jgi:protoheme IX farnesyltransferase
VSSAPTIPAAATDSLNPLDNETIRKYYILTKPGIVYSNAMTAAAGFLFASKGHIKFWHLLTLLAANALVIASACIFNNYIDRDIDAKMARTKKRATANGTISVLAVNLYGAVLGITGLLILTQTNWLTFTIGAAAFISYVVLYGIAKRKSVHGTLVGTLPGSASLVAGYTAATNHLDFGALLLFLVMVFWQMAHFYSIAIFRLADYKKAGLPVMPAVKGVKITKLQIIFYVFAYVIASIDLSFLGYTGLSFLIVMSVLGIYWLFRAINGFKARGNIKWSRSMFGFSLVVLLVFSIMLALDSFLP